MNLPRLNQSSAIADDLNLLSAIVKTRARASLTDANRILETISKRFLNALFGWDLANLNIEQANFPSADLGDRVRKIAIQVTNEGNSKKIKHTAAQAIKHKLGKDFDRLIVFFLLPRKPGFPKQFSQPTNGPTIETWDIADLLKQMQETDDLAVLTRAADVLAEELGKLSPADRGVKIEISRILKYAPTQLIGRKAETALLNDAWERVKSQTQTRPHILTFVALGGEGKTSLVAKWAVEELAAKGWPGCEAVFAWSFYSQGSREQVAVSSDLFLNEALAFFGDEAMAKSAQGAYDKGRRLAQLVAQQKALLILDGLEPLQYAPGSPLAGELKDQGLAALLKGLAAQNRGLCVATTRYRLPDLRAYWQTTAPMHDLLRLSKAAGVELLTTIGVKGTPAEFEQLVEDVKGHALTLNLLGTYLRDAHAGDIRQRDLIKLAEANAEEQGGHAFRVMDGYVRWLEGSESCLQAADGGSRPAEAGTQNSRRTLALWQLLGLFDRPATADCLNALLQPPAIAGLTEPLVGLNKAQLNLSLTRLEDAKLLTVNRDSAHSLVELDAHPLIREYFAARLCQQQPDAWRAAHQRLYKNLLATTNEGDQPTLEDLQPLYQAVWHGCQAGLEQNALYDVYHSRILRREECYSSKKLGALGSNLGAIACFFEAQWRKVLPSFSEAEQAWILNEAGIYLGDTGRLIQALEPIRAGLPLELKQNDWGNASRRAINLSEQELALGDITQAVADAHQSMDYANNQTTDAFTPILALTKYADALHQAGRLDEADALFREAEKMQAKLQPDSTLLYSLRGFQYCDLLLDAVEREAWKNNKREIKNERLIVACRAISERAAKTLKWVSYSGKDSLSIPLDHLTLGRTALYAAILGYSAPIDAQPDIEAAVSGLRPVSHQWFPCALLTRAWLRALTGALTGPESAQSDLDEAWEIASRGPMRLHMADIHLYRARLFGVGGLGVGEKYPWESAAADLAEAERLINECGYHRRDAELADAKRMILGK